MLVGREPGRKLANYNLDTYPTINHNDLTKIYNKRSVLFFLVKTCLLIRVIFNLLTVFITFKWIIFKCIINYTKYASNILCIHIVYIYVFFLSTSNFFKKNLSCVNLFFDFLL